MKGALAKGLSVIIHQATLLKLKDSKEISNKSYLVFKVIPVETSKRAIVTMQAVKNVGGNPYYGMNHFWLKTQVLKLRLLNLRFQATAPGSVLPYPRNGI